MQGLYQCCLGGVILKQQLKENTAESNRNWLLSAVFLTHILYPESAENQILYLLIHYDIIYEITKGVLLAFFFTCLNALLD